MLRGGGVLPSWVAALVGIVERGPEDRAAGWLQSKRRAARALVKSRQIVPTGRLRPTDSAIRVKSEQAPRRAERAFTSPAEDERLAVASGRDRTGEERSQNPMTPTRKPAMSLSVDKGPPANWVVRDREGRFWT